MGKSQTEKGVALMVSACIVFCLMASLIKYVSYIDAYKVVLFRFIIALGLLGSAAMLGRIKLVFVDNRLLFLRGLAGGIAVIIFFLSIAKLGLGKATVICYSFPIFASIYAVILLKEKVKITSVIAVLAAFCGIYLLAVENNPGFSFLTRFGKYEAIAVFGAMLGGISVVFIRKLHDTDSSFAIFFAQSAIGLWLVIIPANLKSYHSFGWFEVAALLAIGIGATVGQLLMTEGYRYIPAAAGSRLMMLVPVLNYFVGVVVFQEPITLRSVIGSIIVLGSCAVVLAGDEKS